MYMYIYLINAVMTINKRFFSTYKSSYTKSHDIINTHATGTLNNFTLLTLRA